MLQLLMLKMTTRMTVELRIGNHLFSVCWRCCVFFFNFQSWCRDVLFYFHFCPHKHNFETKQSMSLSVQHCTLIIISKIDRFPNFFVYMHTINRDVKHIFIFIVSCLSYSALRENRMECMLRSFFLFLSFVFWADAPKQVLLHEQWKHT